MSIPPSALVDVAHYLEEQDEGQRIKKLLFCLSKKYWENDPNVLDSNGVETLLVELVIQKPTIEQLTFALYKLVKTLNRPKVYATVAKTILDQLGPIYVTHTGNGPTPIAPEEAVAVVEEITPVPATPIANPNPVQPMADPQHLAGQIAHVLLQHREKVRIQKLVFAVARGYWENDLQAIEQVGLAPLLLELRQRYPSPGELQEGFNQIVNNINKSTLYLAIAKLIIQQLQGLYVANNNHGQTPGAEDNDEPQTNLITNRRPAAHNNTQQTSIIDFGALPLPVPPPPKPRQNDPLVTVLGAPSPPGTPVQSHIDAKKYNLFDIRSEIIQYTNPLRAKILLFSILFQSWDEHSPDWGLVRSYGLDDLVEQLILSQKRPNDVEIKLNAQAGQMFDQEEYQQAAQTLIKILKPLL